MSDSWQAAAARHRFSELVDAAVEGRPQFVRRRDGQEVVLVSKAYFDQTRPNLKSVLLSCRFGQRGDAFDRALVEARSTLGASLQPRDFDQGVADADSPRHRRSERAAPA
ncbi:MAG TPA: type II toxin-antitoxin system prevent-host-death family antitoxin [Acetobacteraceae bacterium]|nr:type II toxin-antitoxin system prevent-host-death family antitoxin [Acetobacteraceae bacterium]